MLSLVMGVSLLREVQAGFHPPRYAAFLTPPSPWLGHSSYSPDLNPIEQVFSKLKTRLPKAAERKLLDEFSLTECASYLRDLGYAAI